jgi:hypothetical protein
MKLDSVIIGCSYSSSCEVWLLHHDMNKRRITWLKSIRDEDTSLRLIRRLSPAQALGEIQR